MLAIAGDSAAGKTTLTKGLVDALGPERCTSICVDDYHRYDREERTSLPFTPLHPDCNHLDIMEQHLQLLALGRPILKPVYDHSTGTFTRPEYVEPRDFVIVEGLHPLSTKLARACFDATVFLDPPEEIRREWKVARDTSKRGYTTEQVLADLERREPESEAFIRPQRRYADIVARFAPIESRDDPPGTPLSAELMLRRRSGTLAVVGADRRPPHGDAPEGDAGRRWHPHRLSARARLRLRRGGAHAREGDLVGARRRRRPSARAGPDRPRPAQRAAGAHPADPDLPPDRGPPSRPVTAASRRGVG
ncbi:MAG: phosphoribulokinase [Nocardioides sp.]